LNSLQKYKHSFEVTARFKVFAKTITLFQKTCFQDYRWLWPPIEAAALCSENLFFLGFLRATFAFLEAPQNP
jgi:hypothetical protein